MENVHAYLSIETTGIQDQKNCKEIGYLTNHSYKYLDKSPEEMSESMDGFHSKKAEENDWLSERFPKLEVGESKVRSFVQELREVMRF